MQNPPQYNFNPEEQQKILRFQQLQQQLEAYTQQLSNMELQSKDLNYSITELEKADEEATIYKAIGRLFIKKTKSDILESSNSEKESLDLRITSLKSSVGRMKSQFEEERIKIEEIFKTQGYKT
ncbi:MAG: prefoldin subunit [Promethearchaeota archaeon]